MAVAQRRRMVDGASNEREELRLKGLGSGVTYRGGTRGFGHGVEFGAWALIYDRGCGTMDWEIRSLRAPLP